MLYVARWCWHLLFLRASYIPNAIGQLQQQHFLLMDIIHMQTDYGFFMLEQECWSTLVKQLIIIKKYIYTRNHEQRLLRTAGQH